MKEKLKAFFGNKKAVGISIAVVVVVLLLAGAAGVGIWWYGLPKFQDVTIEFGTEHVELEQFFTEYGSADRAAFITDMDSLDYSVGQHPVTLKQDWKEETVVLTIQDTTAPTAAFQDVTATIGQILTPEQFVTESFDLSEITISFAEPLEEPKDYGDKTVTVVVADAYGNSVSGECTISYDWLKKVYTLELGDTLEEGQLLLDPNEGLGLLDPAEIESISGSPVGEYTISGTTGGKTSTCTVTVQDTTPPEIVLEPVSRYQGFSAGLEDFLVSVEDLSGEVTTRLVTELDFKTIGTQTVVIEAEDIYGNIATAETTLEIIPDTDPPYFTGVSTLEVTKNGTPDYTKGVSAYDEHDGTVSFTYNASSVDVTKAGTYYVTYTAKDAAGNVGSYRRKITVSHDAEDTAALVAQHAALCGNDAESIRDYVRNLISYNTNWGGDDPVWYGFTNKVGNCYVHAKCLQVLLSSHGYETKLIWTTQKTHYWLIVKLGDVWRHIDATPAGVHPTYSLMTDEQRLATLSGRTWDFSAWPACE